MYNYINVFAVGVIFGATTLIAQQEVVPTAVTTRLAKEPAPSAKKENRYPSAARPQPNKPLSDSAWDLIELQSIASPASDQPTALFQPRFNDLADQARAFRLQFPTDVRVREAKAIELRSLMNALLIGENAEQARIDSLLFEIRGDSSLSGQTRFQLVKLSEIIRQRNSGNDLLEQLDAQEASARRLIAEFPTESGAYEMLFNIAENHPDSTKGVSLSREITQTVSFPHVRSAAEGLIERHNLRGKRISDLAEKALGSRNLVSAARGKGIILYAWATWSPGSRQAARDIAKLAPSDAILIGINLDSDVENARVLAASEKLPGEQIFESAGVNGKLAQELKLGTDFPIYITNADGDIREVAGHTGNMKAKATAALR